MFSLTKAPILSPLGLAALMLSQEYGLAVFPLHERRSDGSCSCGDAHVDTPKNVGKHPRAAGGFKTATTHPEQVCTDWDRWPNANIGVYPGASQHIVLDIDSPAAEATARELGAFDIPTLETVTQRGVHRWFHLPQGLRLSNRSPWKDLDVRAHNGYVLVPPSVHPSGHVYEWRGALDEIADVPLGVLHALAKGNAAVRGSGSRKSSSQSPNAPSVSGAFDSRCARRVMAYADRLGYGLSDGRKTAAFRFAAFLAHDVGLPDAAALEMLSTWNAGNVPPLAEAILHEIHANARRYGGQRGAA